MIILSEAEILKQCLKLDIGRSTSVVLAHLAHFEQISGGVKIGGQQWRYRTIAEISESVMYSSRTVTRAIADLVTSQFILRKTIWDPRYAGQRVNAYCMLPVIDMLLAEGQASRKERRKRSSKSDLAESEPSTLTNKQILPYRNRHNGSVTNREHINQHDTELITLALPAKESQFANLRDNSFDVGQILKSFDKYLVRREAKDGLNSDVAAIFWNCLEGAVYDIVETAIEPLDTKVTQRALKFLQLFEMSQNSWLGPLDPCAIALWTYQKWQSFEYLISAMRGSPPQASIMSSYHLAKHAYLIINDLKACKGHLTQLSGENPGDWLAGGLK